MEDPKLELMRARKEAAELRTRAAHQDSQAQAYHRQATKPIYAGQETICTGKAAEVEALAAENRARANLIETEAEAAYAAAQPRTTIIVLRKGDFRPAYPGCDYWRDFVLTPLGLPDDTDEVELAYVSSEQATGQEPPVKD